MTSDRFPSHTNLPSEATARQLERRVQELMAIADAGRALASGEETEKILSLILERATTILRCEAGAVLGVDEDGEHFVVLAARSGAPGSESLRGRAIPRAGSLLQRALQEGSPAAVGVGNGLLTDAAVEALTCAHFCLRNAAVAPLRGCGPPRGGLLVINRPGGFLPDDLRFLIALADQALLALERPQEAARLEALGSIFQAVGAATDDEGVIRRAVDTLLQALPGDRGEVMVREEARTRLRYVSRESGISRSRHPELHATTLARGELAVREIIPYAACVPLRAHGRTLGSLLISRHARAFERWEVAFIAAAGHYVGLALEHATLLRQLDGQTELPGRAAVAAELPPEEAEARLARSRWLAALGQLAAGVAHDLNNALNPIIAFAELLKTHANQPSLVRAYADRILMAAQDAAGTVRRIQRFTRRHHTPTPPLPVRLAEVVREAIELTRPNWAERAAGGPVVVVESVDPDLLLHGNPGELRAALLNLLSNALDAMPAGGELRFVGRAEGGSILLAVQDTGTGMPPEVLERALEPFFTTKGAHGTGLGLSEVYGIVGRHGGKVEIESWPGVGTTVVLRLPAAPRPPDPPAVPPPGPSLAAKPSRILLVDDNVLSLEATAAGLRAAGHTVLTATTAEAALRLFAPATFDLVVTDLGLPGLSGWDLVDELRARDPSVRIALLTGWALEEEEAEVQKRGIELVFVKPVDMARLLAAL